MPERKEGPYRAKRPSYDPDANPIRIKCAGNRVYGWVYPDGTIELVCTEAKCRRPDKETRHLFNPTTGLIFSVYVDK